MVFQICNPYRYSTKEDRNAQLIDFIRTCDDDAIKYLYEALIFDKKFHVAEILDQPIQKLFPRYKKPESVRAWTAGRYYEKELLLNKSVLEQGNTLIYMK